MGTYTDLTVAGYPLITSKSAVVPELMTIFRESDRHVEQRTVADRNILVWGEPSESDADEVEVVTEYRCSCSEASDRLDVMGFTMTRARREFEEGRLARIAELESWADEGEDEQWFAEDLSRLKSLDFERYVAALSKVVAQGLRPPPFDDHSRPGLDSSVKYVIDEHDDILFGFFCSDYRLLVRVACSLMPSNTSVIQDISGLIDAGYYGADERVCDDEIQSLVTSHAENAPVIVLTEGSTDATFLRQALKLLYPHLVEYFSFLDFEAARSPGGAGHLAAIVKAFSAAGVTNRIVALFDNDTAAQEAMLTLARSRLNPNIKILRYPTLDLLNSYPTIGPGGLTPMNVNGMAASIELYLGEDVLRFDDGELSPIQWKGYNQALNQYHGEVLNKERIQAAFRKKILRAQPSNDLLVSNDWMGLKLILEQVFAAFEHRAID